MTETQAVSPAHLQEMKHRGDKIAVLTAYDASFASIMDACGIDVVLVGDSLGMVVQGHDSTLPVTMADMCYHTANVRRGVAHALLVADMPYHSYASVADAVNHAQALMAAGAQMVKLEGGAKLLPIIEALIQQQIPVCGHLGLLPQSVKELGGYKVQGRDEAAAAAMLHDARALAAAGVSMIVLECIPAMLAQNISQAIAIPTIGIGAGADCDGQVLVVYDMLGITRGKRPRFVRDFLAEVDVDIEGGDRISAAIKNYIRAVRQGHFPSAAQSYS
ncbi:MAG: 3-methyl-2-oxobutanoate hydroxymethyltransferase [Gammaproteobacteria bacterium]